MTADIYELLEWINPVPLPYEKWLVVGMGIQAEGGTVEDWDTWSRPDTERYKAGVCAQKWASFHGSGVTKGTLVAMARENGWRPRDTELGRGAALDWDDVITAPREDYRIVDPTWIEPAELAAPNGDWDPVRELSTYLSALFEAHEHVGYVTESWTNDEGRHLPKKGVYSRTAGELLHELAGCKGDIGAVIGDYNPVVGAWIRFNPLDGRGVRDDNVTAFRYALIESDTLAVEMQAAIYSEIELPIAALVHSGGKSLHAIVRIDADSKTDYRKRVEFLHHVCAKVGLEIDTANKNPSRLSRMPGVTRNGNRQYLVATKQGRESWDAWKTYIEETNDTLPDFEPLDKALEKLEPLAPALIDGVLREGHKLLLSGPSKAGKSYLLLQLTLAIAEGREWVGWPCSQGRVLYVNLELDRVSCLHRIRDLYQRLGWTPANVANVDLWNLRGKAVPMDALAPKLIRRAAKRRYKAIIIDPIYKVITGDENAADKMAHFCNQFDRVCAELGAAVIYCHHHSKGSQGQKSARDRSSGSGVFARDPDAILDIIELTVPAKMRETVTDRAICNQLAEVMDKAAPAWREAINQDDALVAAKMLPQAEALLGPGGDLSEDVAEVRARMAAATAWRLEGTLREFAPIEPRRFWFRHPIHVPDRDGVLVDAKADGEQPLWQAQQEAQKEARQRQREEDIKRLASAFVPLDFEAGHAELEALCTEAGLTDKRARALFKDAGLMVCADGNVRTIEAGKAFDVENPPEKKGKGDWDAKLTRCRKAIQKAQREAPDGIARIGAVVAILEMQLNTVRGWVARCDEYRRNEDGTITPVEGDE